MIRPRAHSAAVDVNGGWWVTGNIKDTHLIFVAIDFATLGSYLGIAKLSLREVCKLENYETYNNERKE